MSFLFILNNIFETERINLYSDKFHHNYMIGGVLYKNLPGYAEFFKKLRMGIPKEAVKRLVLQAGLEPDMLDNDPEAEVPGSAKAIKYKDDPRYEKYFTQKKAFLDQLKQEMVAEGLNPDIIDTDGEAEIQKEPEDKVEKKKPKAKGGLFAQIAQGTKLRSTEVAEKPPEQPGQVAKPVKEESTQERLRKELEKRQQQIKEQQQKAVQGDQAIGDQQGVPTALQEKITLGDAEKQLILNRRNRMVLVEESSSDDDTKKYKGPSTELIPAGGQEKELKYNRPDLEPTKKLIESMQKHLNNFSREHTLEIIDNSVPDLERVEGYLQEQLSIKSFNMLLPDVLVGYLEQGIDFNKFFTNSLLPDLINNNRKFFELKESEKRKSKEILDEKVKALRWYHELESAKREIAKLGKDPNSTLKKPSMHDIDGDIEDEDEDDEGHIKVVTLPLVQDKPLPITTSPRSLIQERRLSDNTQSGSNEPGLLNRSTEIDTYADLLDELERRFSKIKERLKTLNQSIAFVEERCQQLEYLQQRGYFS